MAAAIAVPSTNISNLDKLLQDVAKEFSEQEMKDAVNWTKNLLHGEYTKIPEDNISKCFDLLRQHGRVSETDTSGIEFYAEKFCKEEATNSSISKEIETYKGKINYSQPDTEPAAQFIGRDKDVCIILNELVRPQADSNRGENVCAINLHGEGGVGKTCLADEVAKRLCLNSDCKSIVVNLRDIKDMKHVYFEVLRKFGQLAVFGSPERIYSSIENLKHELVLVFDNTEDFFMNFQEFKGFLTNMIQHDKQRRLQILLTSRVMLEGVAQVSNYLVKPFAQEASQEILLQRTGFDLSVSLMSDIAELCCNKPLLLKGIAGILKEKLADGEDVLARIETNIAEGSCKKTKGISGKKSEQRTERELKVKQTATDHDGAVLQEVFCKLSEPLRNSLVKLSLFCRDFPLPAAQQMLGRSIKETQFYLNILISKGCVERKRNEGGEKMFDLHPLMQEFLKDETNTPKYQAVYQEAKVLFCNLFRDKLKKLVQTVDTDFIQVYSDFEMDRPNFEQLLNLSPEKEFLTLLQDVREFYLLPCLLEPLLTVQEREGLFHSLAETAVKEGNLPFAANLKCWEALQVNQAQGGKKARKVLAKAEKILLEVPEKNSEQYEGAKSMYLYAEGKTYYKLSQSETKHKDDYCRKALQSLQQSLELTEKIYGKHTATARCFNEMGNCYNRLENLEMASAYYEKAYKMRKELSGSSDHNDMAVDLNQIAIVHEQTGAKLLKEKKIEEGKKELNKAIEFYQKALDLEIKLKIDGYSNTALFKRNMANAYLHLDETEKAWKPALEAYEIRQRVLGTHPDTVRSLFQLGNVKYWGNDYPAALEYFYKAHEMEESLPKGHHSQVRQKIKKRIVDTGGTVEDGDPKKQGMLKSFGSSIKRKAGNVLQVTKQGFLNVLGKQGGPVSESVEQSSGHSTEDEFVDVKEEELKERTVPLRVTPSGCVYPLPTFGLNIYFPPNAVTEPIEIKCTVIPEAMCPSLPIRGYTLVSNVVRMEPENIEFSKAAVISLMHCHPKRTLGYENVVKFLDPVSKEWRNEDMFAELNRPADVKRRFDSLEDAPGIRTPYVQVKLPRCQTLAVFSRLVVDVFHVDPCGDEFTSTVTNLVKVKFLRGAVDKTSDFSMKVVGNAGYSCGSGNAHGGPTVFLSLKSDPIQRYSKPVTIQLPLPVLGSRSSSEEGSLKIFRCETSEEDEHELPWSDITDEVAASLNIQEDVVQFDVGHFCWFTCCYTWANEKIGDLLQYILAPKKSVSFGAFVNNGTLNDFPLFTLVFTCCASHKQDEVRERQEDHGYNTIGEQNSDQEMAVNEKAYFEVSGGIRNVKTDKEWFVTFREEWYDKKSIRIEVVLPEEQNCAEFKTKEEDLCWMPILKLTEKVPTVTENPKHYCGIALETLSEDMPEDIDEVFKDCFDSKARRNIDTQTSWHKKLDTMWNEVTQLSPESEEQFFQIVVKQLQSTDLIAGSGHLASWLLEGRKMIKEPIDLKKGFHMDVFEIVAKCSDKVYWKKLARRLGMQHNIIENIEDDYKHKIIYEQCYQMLVSWTQRTGRTTSNAASLEKLLSALTGMKCFDAVELVAKRITIEVKI